MIPRNELQQLLVLEQDVAFDADSRTLVAWGREGVTEFRVSELPDTVPPEERLPDELQEQRYGWVGTDGQLARVVWFGDKAARPVHPTQVDSRVHRGLDIRGAHRLSSIEFGP